MKTLKTEEVDGRTYRDLAHATAAIGCFTNDVYNTQRLQSALDDLSPVEFETRSTSRAAVRQPQGAAIAECPEFL